MSRLIPLATLACAALAAGTLSALAQEINDQGAYGKVIRIDREAFLPEAGLITFSEMTLDTQNPVFRPSDYGGKTSGVTVSFGGYFNGQRLGGVSDQCPEGAAETGCVFGTPSAPLSLDLSGPGTAIAMDGSNENSPVLSGSPQFNGPVSMVFDRPVAGVGLNGGVFNELHSTSIAAFDKYGRQIGGVVNLTLGIEYLALVTEDGSESIAGLQFSLVGPEPAGFAIDDVSFARSTQLQESVRGKTKSIKDILSGGNMKPETETPVGGTPAKTKSIKDILSGDNMKPKTETPKGGKPSISDLLKKY
jgi:hypothetical protein